MERHSLLWKSMRQLQPLSPGAGGCLAAHAGPGKGQGRLRRLLGCKPDAVSGYEAVEAEETLVRVSFQHGSKPFALSWPAEEGLLWPKGAG